MARIDQIKVGDVAHDIALPVDSKDTMFYTTASATSNKFTVTIPDFPPNYYTGLAVNLKFNAATAIGCTLNVNSLGEKAIYYRNSTACTTHIPANMFVTLVYDEAAGGAGQNGWVMQGSYWADTHYTNSFTVKANSATAATFIQSTNTTVTLQSGTGVTVSNSGATISFNGPEIINTIS